MLGAYVFTMFISSWWILPLSIMKCPFRSLFISFVLQCILSDICIATGFFFSALQLLGIFFSDPSFSVCVSLLFWGWSLIGMCRSCFLIHSTILCLLIGAFNPFTSKVITDRYLFIASFSYLCSSLSLSFPSFPYTSPFSISCRAFLVEIYSFRLLLSGKFLIWHSVHIESCAV